MVTLQEIETFVLVTVGYTRYAELSVATGDEQIEDFSLLHRCVFLARDEIKKNCLVPSIMKLDTITTVASQKAYSLATDFDLPVRAIYLPTGGSYSDLIRLTLENLVQKKGNLAAVGTPDSYLIIGNLADVIQMELYDTPQTAGESVFMYYKPVLTNLTTSTDESTLMQRYPNTIINLASAFFFQLVKKDKAQFDKYYLLGSADFAKIDFREKDADSSYREIPDSLTRTRRMARFSK